MIPPERLVLLDTNVLLHIARGKAAGEWIVRRYGLRTRTEKPLVSAVSVGEIWRMAYRRGWGDARLASLAELVSEMLIIGLEPDVVTNYGRFGAHLDRSGKPIPQNDIWIAATAASKRAVLITMDSDFDHLHPHRIEREYIDPGELPRE